VISFENARIDVGGAPLITSLTLDEPGPNLGLVGGWSAWFRLLSADATLAAGRALLAGTRAETAVREGVAGVALCDPPLPPRTKAGQYLEHSAALRGAPRRHSGDLARQALERLELTALERRPIGDLSRLERRGLLIAHALLGPPRVMCLETPLADLDSPSQGVVAAWIERAQTAAALVVSVARPYDDPAERALLDRLGRVLVLEAGALVGQGPAAQVFGPGSRYLVTVTRSGEAFRAALRAQGARVEPAAAPWLAAAILKSDGARPERFVVELSDRQSSDSILDAALGASAPLVELVPIRGSR
jgi:ABC-type multidrug transport system ATPase subunit